MVEKLEQHVESKGYPSGHFSGEFTKFLFWGLENRSLPSGKPPTYSYAIIKKNNIRSKCHLIWRSEDAIIYSPVNQLFLWPFSIDHSPRFHALYTLVN